MGAASRFLLWLGRLIGVASVLVVAGGIIWYLTVAAPTPRPPPLAAPAEPDGVEVAGWGSLPAVGPRIFGPCVRVLAIDGGGVRGIIPAMILAHIEKATGRPISDQFNLIVGTSTGSIIALGLTRPGVSTPRKPAFAAAQIAALFEEHAPDIFPYEYEQLRALRQLVRPKYDPASVEAVFAKYFGEERIGRALTEVAVPAYDFENGRRLWLTNREHGDLLMRDIARGATAVPTYFPPARLAVQKRISPSGYITLVDGALFANNPAQEALSLAERLIPSGDRSLLLLSIGTGRLTVAYTYEEVWSWGAISWSNPILEIVFNDPSVDYHARRAMAMRGGSYYRLQLDLGQHPPPLDASAPNVIAHLKSTTERFLANPPTAERVRESQLERVLAELRLPRSPACGKPIGTPVER
ncbi:MAG: patatin-like phospholipase family protein [Hyphomicrobiaceae bacterium]